MVEQACCFELLSLDGIRAALPKRIVDSLIFTFQGVSAPVAACSRVLKRHIVKTTRLYYDGKPII